MNLIIDVVVVLAMNGAAVSFPDYAKTGHARVIDGNTLEISGQKFQIFGTDAPDIPQGCFKEDEVFYRCGYESARYLHSLIDGKRVHCLPVERVQPHVTLARCSTGGKDLGEKIVKEGYAVVAPGIAVYSGEEAEAKQSKRGLWSGKFMLPHQWRSQKSDPVIQKTRIGPVSGSQGEHL